MRMFESELLKAETLSVPDNLKFTRIGGVVLGGNFLGTAESWHDTLMGLIDRTGYVAQLAEIDEQPVREDEVKQREWDCFNKWLTGVKSLASGHTGEVRLLCDVDQTLTEGGVWGKPRVVRPAFGLFLHVASQDDELKDRFRVGVLSTLSPSEAWVSCLRDVNAAMIDKDFLIGTEEYGRRHPELALKGVRSFRTEYERDRILEGVREILHPRIYEAVREGTVSLGHVHDPAGKLEIVQHLRSTHPDTALGFTDNFASAGVLRRDDPLLRGIHVGPEVQSGLCAVQRNLLDQRVLQKLGTQALE